MRALWVWLLCLGIAAPALALSGDDLNALLGEANTLFRQANDLSLQDAAAARDLYRRAALRYERIVREGGIHNGRLFYDIGNAYFRAQDIGRAILYYRRAQLFIPGDSNVEQNLQYARSRRRDTFEEAQRTQVLKTLLFWHYDLSPRVRSVLFGVLFALFWIGAAVRLLRPSLVPRAGLIVTGVLAAVLLGSLLVESTTGGGRNEGVIVAQQVIARKGDGESYEPSFVEPLHAGAEFRLVRDRDDWLQIELRDGRRCWIPARVAGLVGRI